MAFAATDLIAVDRSSTAYKETYTNRSNIDTTDYLMVERSNTKYKCARYDWDGGGGGSTSGLPGSTPQASDLLLVERPAATLSMTAVLGATTLYVSSIPAALSSGTRLVFDGTAGNAEFELTSSASAGATTLTGTGGLKGSEVANYTTGGVLYKATKADWDGAPSGQDIYSATYTEDIDVHYITSGDSSGPYDVLTLQIDVGGSSQTGRLYVGQKNNASTYYYGDIALGAFQVFESDGSTLRYAWSFDDTPYSWSTMTTYTLNAATDPSGFSYTTISSSECATKRRWCRCLPGGCATSSRTGATAGISSAYGTAGGSTGGVTAITTSTISQTGGEYYVYNETSSTSSNGEVVWLRTPSITVSTGDYIKLAYLAATSSSGVTTTANTMWFFWA